MRRQQQSCRRLPVRQPLGDEVGDAVLALGEAVPPEGRPVGGADARFPSDGPDSRARSWMRAPTMVPPSRTGSHASINAAPFARERSRDIVRRSRSSVTPSPTGARDQMARRSVRLPGSASSCTRRRGRGAPSPAGERSKTARAGRVRPPTAPSSSRCSISHAACFANGSMSEFALVAGQVMSMTPSTRPLRWSITGAPAHAMSTSASAKCSAPLTNAGPRAASADPMPFVPTPSSA